MGVFKYKLLTPQGKIDKDIIYLPFDDPSPAVRFLEKQGGVVLDISPASFIGEKIFFFVIKFRGIKRSEMAEFFNNLSILVKSGVSILGALEEVNKSIKNRRLNFLIKSIITDIEMGQTFSEAVARHKDIFSPLIVHMTRIGEETGRLDDMLEKIKDHILRMDKIITDTKRAIRYPAFLFFMLLGAFLFWFWYVVPQIIRVFKDMDLELPWTTKFLLVFSKFMRFYFPWIILIVAVLLGLVFLFKRRSEKLNYLFDKVVLNIPIFSSIINTSIIAKVCENLGILISSGITIIRALDIIIATLSNVVYKDSFKKALSQVESGNTLSGALGTTSVLPSFVVRMIHVGEESGRLPEQLDYVASIYRNKLEYLVDTLSKSLEPVLLIIMGVFFALIMVGMLLPVYNLVSSIGMGG